MFDELPHPYILLNIWPFQVIRLCPRDDGDGGRVVQAGQAPHVGHKQDWDLYRQHMVTSWSTAFCIAK